MSDKDLVFRGDVKAFKQSFIYDGGYPDVKLVSAVTIEDIDSIQPVPHEMSAREFFEEYRRMCEYTGRCAICPIMEIAEAPRTPCRYLAYAYPDKAVAIVEKWAREHPERSKE